MRTLALLMHELYDDGIAVTTSTSLSHMLERLLLTASGLKHTAAEHLHGTSAIYDELHQPGMAIAVIAKQPNMLPPLLIALLLVTKDGDSEELHCEAMQTALPLLPIIVALVSRPPSCWVATSAGADVPPDPLLVLAPRVAAANALAAAEPLLNRTHMGAEKGEGRKGVAALQGCFKGLAGWPLCSHSSAFAITTWILASARMSCIVLRHS